MFIIGMVKRAHVLVNCLCFQNHLAKFNANFQENNKITWHHIDFNLRGA